MLPSPIPESISQLFALILILFWRFPHLFPEAAPSHSLEWLGAEGIGLPARCSPWGSPADRCAVGELCLLLLPSAQDPGLGGREEPVQAGVCTC